MELRNLVFFLEYLVSNGRQVLLRGIRLGDSATYMLQVLHLNVSKVDRVLHLPPRFLLPRLGVSSSSRHRLGMRRSLSLFPMMVTFGAVQAPRGRGKRTANADVRTLASP